eukprot:XP_011680693.1 PREDICTED: uncharacterized protein LOC105446067 [Strongylocentrotus purpuratus]
MRGYKQGQMSDLRGSSRSSGYMSDIRGSSTSSGYMSDIRWSSTSSGYMSDLRGSSRSSGYMSDLRGSSTSVRSVSKKSGQETVMRDDAGLELHVEWMSNGDKTHLVLWDHADHFQDVISILAPLCCELQLEGASAAVPMTDLMHLVSNELKGVTVLTFDRCKVDIQSISHPPQGTEGESSLRELKFLNVECPLSQTDIHKLSEMYPNVKVTVEHKSQASHEDSEQGTRMPFKPERKTFPSFPPSPTSSTDDLVGARAKIQVHEEQTDTQNTEEERKEEEEEDHIAMESLPHETDEVNVKPIKMECCKRVGVEGGKLQLDSFGIELEIPPGAIDSEAPQDISLRVLTTDTPNLGNSKEEMSVCFGVQCLAPDDLVIKLPVTYTIPHCAVITRYSSVEAVLYTGEGEYSIDAEVKEQIPLTQSGIPNCNIERDTLRLQMNHFSWAFIRFKLTVFFGGKRMRCLPFAEKPLPEERTTVVLRAHLYDDIKGIYMKIASQEECVGFACIHPEAEVLISAAEVDVKMTCFIKRDPIGDTIHTVKYDELCRGHHRTRSFNLDLRSQPDEKIVVTLQVGQTGHSVEELLCIFKFTTPRRSTSLLTHDLEQLQGASSSQTLQASHQRTREILELSSMTNYAEDTIGQGPSTWT